MKSLIPIAALLGLLGCDSLTGTEGEREVTVRFATTRASAAGPILVSPARLSHIGAADGAFVVEGSNGKLAVHDVRLIVSEFELEAREGSCAMDDDDDCPDFDAPPSLVVLPLDGSPVSIATGGIPAGTYTELEFEVEDLDLDEDDDEDSDGDEAARRQALLDILESIRGVYPDFPSDASMVVHGSFTPSGGAAREFTVYFDAEIEVEMDLDPPLTVPGATEITVEVDPTLWFRSGDQVLDLSRFDGRTLEFELEIERGFKRVDHDDD